MWGVGGGGGGKGGGEEERERGRRNNRVIYAAVTGLVDAANCRADTSLASHCPLGRVLESDALRPCVS